MRNYPMACSRARRGFTLIELLVVISIIAILISILLPVMKSARRQVMVLRCMNNFKQLGIGLAVYVQENDNRYPPPFGTWSGPIYDILYGAAGTEPDGRVNFMQIAGDRPADLLWCPLYHQKGPIYDGVDEWSRHYLSCRPQCWYPAGYNIHFLFANNAVTWNWTNSGNPDTNGDGNPDGPYEPGHSQAAIISDVNWWDPAQCSANGPETVCWSVHNNTPWSSGGSMRVMDSNTLYGDGHAVTRSRLEYWITRAGGNTSWY